MSQTLFIFQCFPTSEMVSRILESTLGDPLFLFLLFTYFRCKYTTQLDVLTHLYLDHVCLSSYFMLLKGFGCLL